MEETKENVGATSRGSLSEDMRRSREAYRRIFDKMPKRKERIINLMFGSWGFTQTAREAYEAVKNPEYTDTQRIYSVGNWSDMSLARLKDVMTMLEKGLSETLDAIDDTGKWLEEQGWHGLPSPIDSNGACCRKTARDIYNDMIRFSKTKSEYVKQVAAQKQCAGDRR